MENFIIKEIEVLYKNSTVKSDRNKITCSNDAYNIFKNAFGNAIEYKECFYIMALNNANDVLGFSKISEGGINYTSVDNRLIFQTILKAHSTAFIICHNHPSGKLYPSKADKDLTETIKKGADLLNLNLLDHLIITADSYTSFADDGIL